MSEVRKAADEFDDEDDDDIFRAAFSTQKNVAKVKIDHDDKESTATATANNLGSQLIIFQSKAFCTDNLERRLNNLTRFKLRKWFTM